MTTPVQKESLAPPQTIHFDCLSGIAGDMTVSALIDCGLDQDWLLEELSKLKIGEFDIQVSDEKRYGFAAKGFEVSFPHQHVHRHLSDICQLLENVDYHQDVKDLALRIFRRLASAEAKVHGSTIEKVHFHEVGAVDSIIDIVAVALAIWKMNIQRITFSNLVTGFGSVKIDHGLVSIPAPATTELLKGFKVKAGEIEGELVTPTGAAILAELAIETSGIPEMKIAASGFGAGKKDFSKHANVLKATIGSTPADKKKRATATTAHQH